MKFQGAPQSRFLARLRFSPLQTLVRRYLLLKVANRSITSRYLAWDNRTIACRHELRYFRHRRLLALEFLGPRILSESIRQEIIVATLHWSRHMIITGSNRCWHQSGLDILEFLFGTFIGFNTIFTEIGRKRYLTFLCLFFIERQTILANNIGDPA